MDEVWARGLHPLLARRWSPTRFDASHEAEPGEVELLLEAARWAPSAGNSQPWSFVAALREDDLHRRIVPHLAASSARWAPGASVLVVNLAHRHVEGTDWEYSEFSLYDLGQAVAHMTLQASALGWYARQFRAFDQDGLGRELAVPPHWQVTTMSAFGRLPADPDEAGTPPRTRHSAADIRWPTP